jgi:hypothetical protein
MGSFQPTLRIDHNKFNYYKAQNSYLGKQNKKQIFISQGIVRQSSIDSILCIINGLEDSSIFKFNPCIMSGAIIFLTIAHESDTTKFEFRNTFDCTALKIIGILNSYLSSDEKLYGSGKDIVEEENCWIQLKEKWKQKSSDSSDIKQ